MKKVISWIAGFTKVGQLVKKIQGFLDGKKQYIAGTSMMIPSLLTIIQKFQEGGLEYLLGAGQSPEFLALTGGFAIIANAAKGEKIRKENAVIIEKQENPKV